MGRWFLTFLLLGLLAGFTYWVWPRVRGQRHLIVAAIWATDPLTVPPMSFVREDFDALLRSPDVQPDDATDEGQDEASFEALADRMAKRARSAEDTLIVYIAAHGVADEDSAYLVCSDFARSADRGRYAIRRLLEKIAKSPAGLKLIILDTGRLNYDPRLGIIGNEFVLRVASAVQSQADAKLWVLVASGESEGIAVSHADRRSVFGRAVADALAGEATRTEYGGDGNRFVDLREFTQFVQTQCRQWFGAELPNHQSPLLFHGGHGIVSIDSIPTDDQHRLVFVQLDKPKTESESKPAETPPAAAPAETKKGVTAAIPMPVVGPVVLRVAGADLPKRLLGSSTVARRASEGSRIRANPLLARRATVTFWAKPPGAESAKPQQSDLGRRIRSATATQPFPSGHLGWFQAATSSAGEKPADEERKTDPAPTGKAEPEAPAKAQDTAAPKSPDAPKTQPGTDKESPPAETKKSVPQPLSNSPPEVRAAPPKATELPTTSEQRMRIELQRLWELRDRLRDRPAANGMSPIDFAPHIWREAEAWLLYYEQRARSGRAVPSSAVGDARDKEDVELRLRDMGTLAADLERLVAAMNGDPPVASRDEKSVGDRLLSAWQRYLREQKPADDQFDREADELRRETRQAARRLSDQLYNAMYFVRWFGSASNALSDTSRYRDAIGAYLDELASASRDLRQLERAPVPASDQARLRQFILRQQQLTESERKLAAELTAIEESALARMREHVSQRRVEELLATPRLSASRRGRLLDELLHRNTPPVTMTNQDVAAGSSNGLSQLMSQRRDCLLLEAKLIQIADKEYAQRIATLAQPPGTAEHSDVVALRLRNGVREVMQFYVAVPRLLTSDLALHLVDARDASAVDADKFPLPAFRVEVEQTSELRIIPLAKTLQLQPGKPTKLSVTLRATKRNLLDSRVMPANSEGLLSFESLSEEELPPDRGWHSKVLHWNVTAKPEAVSERKNHTLIAVTAEGAGGIKASTAIDVDLPQPDRVDVFLTRLGSTVTTGGAADDITLALFSNRKTKFQCALANQHDQPKTVHVTLYAIAPRPLAKAPIGKLDASIRRSVYDGKSHVFLDAKPVAKSEKPVQLPAADPNKSVQERVLFNFVNPNAPALAPSAAGTAPAAASPQPAPEPLHGLVLEIVDAKDNQPIGLKWIELEPMSPRDFLDIVVGYDQRQQQIVARLGPKRFDDQRQPELPAGKAVAITWDPSDAKLPAEGKKNLAGEIDSALPPHLAVLTAEADADGQDRVVKIGVDGYPRAFLYRVNCRRDPTAPDLIPGVDLERETTSIKIDSITVPSQNRVYHFLPDFVHPLPSTDEKAPKIEHLSLTPRIPALFRAPAEVLIVNLQADAPLDAFRNDTDRVQVTLRENSFTRTIRADRNVEAAFIGGGARGVLELETKVGDLAIRLSPGSLQNVQTVIDSDIHFRDLDDADSILVQLDGDDPRIEELQLPKLLPKDAKVLARFFVRDYHGVKRATYGFSKDGSPKLAEADSKSTVVVTRLDDDKRHVFDIEIDLKDQPIGKRLLLAKVEDHVGHESPLVAREIMIFDPKAMPDKGEIRGVIRFGPAKVNGLSFKMTIEGGELGPTPVVIQPDGSFLIPNLPIGDYTLKVLEGSFNGKSVPPKEQKGVKPVDPKKPVPITVDVSG